MCHYSWSWGQTVCRTTQPPLSFCRLQGFTELPLTALLVSLMFTFSNACELNSGHLTPRSHVVCKSQLTAFLPSFLKYLTKCLFCFTSLLTHQCCFLCSSLRAEWGGAGNPKSEELTSCPPWSSEEGRDSATGCWIGTGEISEDAY